MPKSSSTSLQLVEVELPNEALDKQLDPRQHQYVQLKNDTKRRSTSRAKHGLVVVDVDEVPGEVESSSV